ncbi:hypothetical protein [Marivirga lumbricoides]
MSVSKASLLDKIDKLLEEEMIVGYTVDGEPLTKKAYDMRLQKAEEQLSSGEYVSQEDLEKESVMEKFRIIWSKQAREA